MSASFKLITERPAINPSVAPICPNSSIQAPDLLTHTADLYTHILQKESDSSVNGTNTMLNECEESRCTISAASEALHKTKAGTSKEGMQVERFFR